MLLPPRLPTSVARRELQIHDRAVARQIGVEGEVDLADQLFVRTGGAELAPAQHDLAPLDPKPHNARVGGGRGDQHDEHRSEGDLHRRPPTLTLHP
ncbi:MAG: hypothetical protein DMF93_25635 [Acidobacteria bacterium]|nr:MAG: hypothetical protein DMF93_25635 [Acidobacteriota bacterium]